MLCSWMRALVGFLAVIAAQAGVEAAIGELDFARSHERNDFGRQLIPLGGPDGARRLAILESAFGVEDVWIGSGSPLRSVHRLEFARSPDACTALTQRVADCDGDGWDDFAGVELAARSGFDLSARAIAVSSATGVSLWRSSAPVVAANTMSGGAPIFVSDLDGDRIPELVTRRRRGVDRGEPGLELIDSSTGRVRASAELPALDELHAVDDVDRDRCGDLLARTQVDERLLSGDDLALVRSFPLCLDSVPGVTPPQRDWYRLEASAVAEVAAAPVWIGCYASLVDKRVDCVSIASGETLWTAILEGSVRGEQSVVRVVGDLNGDYTSEIAVGVPTFMRDGVCVLSGRDGAHLRGEPTSREALHGWNCHYGTDIAPLWDVDGDGVDDYAVSDVQGGNDNPGRVHIRSGKTGTLLDSFGAIRLMSRGRG